MVVKSKRYRLKLYHVSILTTMFRLLVISLNQFIGTFDLTKFII